MQSPDDNAALDLGGAIVHRQQVPRIAEQLFDGGLLRAFGGAVVAGGARLPVMNLVEGRDDLVVEVVDDVAADGCYAVGGFDDDVHRAFGVGVGGVTVNPGHQ